MPVPLVNVVELRQGVEILDSIAPRPVVDRALRAASINRDVLRSHPGFLPYATEAVLLESVARSLGERHLGALVGKSFDYNGFQAFARFVLAAPFLGDALARSRRALPLLHPGSDLSLRQAEGNLVFGFRSGLERVVGHHQLDEGAIFLITFVFRQFLGEDWQPTWIEVPGQGRLDGNYLEELAGTEVRRNADTAAIAVRLEDLFAANPAPPAADEIVTLGELPSLMGVSQPKTMADTVKEVMRAQLKLGDLSEDSVASRLSMGPRTLQRSLMVEGVSFRELRNTVLEARACALLSDSDISIEAIARSLGYSEPRSFRRAFHGWTGVSPGRFRKERGKKRSQ